MSRAQESGGRALPFEHGVRVFKWVDRASHPVGHDLPLNDGSVLPTGMFNVFSPDDCEQIIASCSRAAEQQAMTGDGAGISTDVYRNSRVRQIFPDEPDYQWIFDRLESVVAKLRDHFRFDLTGFFEGAQLYRYPTGGYLDWHMDIGRGHMSTRKLGVTVQISPGDSYDGGDLEFADSTQPAPRAQGAVVVFPGYMRHRVTPVTRGARFSLVSWVHGPPFR